MCAQTCYFLFLFFQCHFFLFHFKALCSLLHLYFTHFPSLSPFPTDNHPSTKLWSLAPAPPSTLSFLTTFSHFDLNWAAFLHPELCNTASAHHIRSCLVNWQIWPSLLSTHYRASSHWRLSSLGENGGFSLESWTHHFCQRSFN